MAKALSYAAALAIAAVQVVAGVIGGILAAIFGSSQPAGASEVALADIPPEYLVLYQRSAQLCPGLDWAILASIGKIESDHGRSDLPGVHSGHNGVLGGVDGARGPLQFLTGTWNGVRTQHPDVGPNVYNPAHAIRGAAYFTDRSFGCS